MAAPPYMGVMGAVGGGGAAPAMGTFGGAFNTNGDIFKTPFGGGPPSKLTAPSHRSDHKLNYFLFSFYLSLIICLEGKLMTPRQGNAILFCSSQQLPRLCLRLLKGFLG